MATLWEEVLMVKEKDPGGKKFDKVSRFMMMSNESQAKVFLDVNTDVYSVDEGDRLLVTLASTLMLDGTPMDETSYDPSILSRPSLADKYEYVMHGRVFRYVEDSKAGSATAGTKSLVSVVISFGGLLMMIKSDPTAVAKIELDSHVFLLMRKIAK